MKNILNNKLKNKLITYFFVLVFLFNFSISLNTSFAQSTSPDQVVSDIQKNYSGGLVPDCGRTGNGKAINDKACSPKDAISLVMKIAQIGVFVVVIALVLVLLISGVGYVYYGSNPQYINKMKGYIYNSSAALVIIILLFGIFAFLSAIGFNPEILKFFNQIFAFNDFSFISHAYAQEIPQISTGGSGYINFFSWSSIFSPILLSLKFIINYFVAPALVIATVIAGFMFVKAEGNPQQLDEAKKFIKRVVIGIVIAATAQMVVSILLNTMKDVASQAGISISPSTQATTTDQTGN